MPFHDAVHKADSMLNAAKVHLRNSSMSTR